MSSATFASRTSVGEIGAVDEKLLSRQRQLVQLPELRLHEEATRTLRYELDLPADERRRDQLEPEERHTIRETEEDAVMDGLSYREFERLAGFVPGLQHWQDAIWTQLVPPKTGVAGSFAAALAMAGMAGDF